MQRQQQKILNSHQNFLFEASPLSNDQTGDQEFMLIMDVDQ